MKQYLLILLSLALSLSVYSQADTSKPHLYDPNANAETQITDAVAIAKKEKKHVLLQIGGNWCIWCIRFHKFVESDSVLKASLDANYVAVHINYSPENKNEKLLSKLEYPNRFGYPVFVILDAKRIHTQNSAYLEEDKSYSKKKVAEFFKGWSPAALDPKTYKK
jgi:thiol:disulfide interchange protein